ncbi:OmpA family protein [Nesterenkonia sp. CL21]|uniref:OmpA family protein n=1 Tax=Nesterenkonia sp. CL21 TaxID=3064894 RepID=UPI002878B92B|nr:OmpA family protein [Nesterenkonia sp. CL21]MDS2173810.1 OmpA family protein [Nesterenkonia sp. CL21]
MRSHDVRIPAGVAVGMVVLLGTTAAVHPGHVGAPVEQTETLDGPPERPEDLKMDDAVHAYDPDPFIYRYEAQDFIEHLGDPTVEAAEENLISLSTDILFRINSWELPDSAGDHLAELVDEIPESAEVQVTGHTDSVPTGEEFDNQELSERRAEAVADVLSEERPDLTLEVSGKGDTEPAVTEEEEDPATYAANRRVEIVYED